MNLSFKKIFAFFIWICTLSNAQVSQTWNLPNYDDKLLHYGFILATNYTRFITKHSQEFINRSDTIKTITPVGSAGFTLGFIFNARMYDFFDFRITPSVGFYQRGINYEFFNNGKKINDIQTIESTFIELPLLVKYKSERRKNVRFYFIGGIKPAISTSSKNRDQRPDKLRTQNFDLSIDYGFGLDKYYPLFKLAPEIRFSHGLLNMAVKDPHIYSQTIKSLTTHTVTLFFNFE